MPKNESFVETPDGVGTISLVDYLRETVKVRLEDVPETPQSYQVDEIRVVRNGKGHRPEGYVAPDRAELEKLRKTPAPVEEQQELELAERVAALGGASGEERRQSGRRTRSRQEQPAGKPKQERRPRQQPKDKWEEPPAQQAEAPKEGQQTARRRRRHRGGRGKPGGQPGEER